MVVRSDMHHMAHAVAQIVWFLRLWCGMMVSPRSHYRYGACCPGTVQPTHGVLLCCLVNPVIRMVQQVPGLGSCPSGLAVSGTDKAQAVHFRCYVSGGTSGDCYAVSA